MGDLEKVETKLTRWKRKQLTLAGRIMVLNHYIIPSIIYFLSCWRPPDSDIKTFTRLCRNYLWGGDPWNRSIAKVKWNTCTLPKEAGGLGIRDINHTAERMASKWILRAIENPQEEWVRFLLKDLTKFHITGANKCTNLPTLTIIASKHDITPKGSQLAVTIWKAWNRIKKFLSFKEGKTAGVLGKDSIWWSSLPLPSLSQDEEVTAKLLHKKGASRWLDIMNI